MEKLLEVKDLKVSFFTDLGETQAVKDAGFAIEEGDFFGIVGESGSGKSVTTKSILRLGPSNCRIMGGEILFQGEDILKKSEAELREIRGGEIAMIFQDPMTSLDPLFTVEYQLDEAGGECQMPNFLLQPIVENAICHGADLCESERGKIKIEYIYGEEFLEFHVYNNGPKVVGEELERILNTPGKGYGIYNIRERIRMYYDEECGLYSSTTDEGMVCFSIKIRKEIENK